MCKHEPDYTDANVSRLAAAPRASLVFSVPFSIEWKQGFISSRVKWLELNWVVRTCIYMYILFTFHSRRVVFQVGETSTNPIFLSNGGV